MSAPDDDSAYNPNALARDLMMPTGEPAAAVIAAVALLGMIWFAASAHLAASAAQVPSRSTAAAQRSAPPPSLQSNGGPIAPPALPRSAG